MKLNPLPICLLVASVWSASARAAVIQFPDEELSTESVLPVFDQPQSVKLRNVVTNGRFELGALGGYSLVEAFFQPYSVGLTSTFHFTEEHGFNLLFVGYLGGSSSYATQLNPIPNSGPPAKNFNVQYAPGPKYLALGSWQYTAFYGKFSLARDYVMNLSLYGLLGLGAMGVGDAALPVVSAGFGQKFYLNKNLALRADLRFLIYQGPDVTSVDLSTTSSVQSSSAFSQNLLFGSLLTLGASYFFGG